MPEIEKILHAWGKALCKNINMGAILARNPTANKWKAIYRCFDLRETVSWRVHDLLTQAQMLFEAEHILGSRILIRSAMESVSILIRLNQLMANVLAGTLDFHEFSEETSVMSTL